MAGSLAFPAEISGPMCEDEVALATAAWGEGCRRDSVRYRPIELAGKAYVTAGGDILGLRA
jgi:hypothetical protein